MKTIHVSSITPPTSAVPLKTCEFVSSHKVVTVLRLSELCDIFLSVCGPNHPHCTLCMFQMSKYLTLQYRLVLGLLHKEWSSNAGVLDVFWQSLIWLFFLQIYSLHRMVTVHVLLQSSHYSRPTIRDTNLLENHFVLFYRGLYLLWKGCCDHPPVFIDVQAFL